MEKEYDILKTVSPFNSLSNRKFNITQDTFSFYKPDKQEEAQPIHISELRIVKIDKIDNQLMLILTCSRETIQLACKFDENKLLEIRDFLSIIKRYYSIILIDYFYQNNIEGGYNTREFKYNLTQYLSENVVQQITDNFKTNESAIDKKTFEIWETFKKYKFDYNEGGSTDINPFEKMVFKKNDEEGLMTEFKPEDIDTVTKYFTTLMQMLVLIRRNQIECRFKRVELINEARINYEDKMILDHKEKEKKRSKVKLINETKNKKYNDKAKDIKNKEIKGKSESKGEFDQETITNNKEDLTLNKESESKEEQNEKLKQSNYKEIPSTILESIKTEDKSFEIIDKLKEENKKLKNDLFKCLDLYSKNKEKLKRYIIKTHIKIYSCYNCGNLLQSIESIQPTCEYDKNCTQNSLFSCLKCNIYFCTYCIIYQRNSKCAQNHRLFPSKDPNLCLLCDNSDSKTYFTCEHCNVAVCSKCMGERPTKEINCWNCNMELTWRKEVYAQCNKCLTIKDCFWGCSNCEYSLCLNCVQTNKGFCGAAHKLDQFNLESSWFNLSIDAKTQFSHNLYLRFMGKCMKCDEIIEGIGYCCSRCSYFICQKCYEE